MQKIFLKLLNTSSILLIALLFSTIAKAENLEFIDIASNPESGLTYQRTPSLRKQRFDELAASEFILQEQLLTSPFVPLGLTGNAVLDFDNDGDLDIYVPNGPGSHNSLFSNQLNESGELRFVDVGMQSGSGLIGQDSSAVCYADTDNDGDADLFVLGSGEGNRFLENQGDGTFIDLTANSQLGGGMHNSIGCSFGDINNDGLVDVVVGNMHDINNALSLFVLPFTFAEHNQLYLNLGNNTFADISAESGIKDHALMPAGAAGLTWAIAILDYDQDGDMDIVTGDDQGDIVRADLGGVDVGFVHIFENDGTGKFTDITEQANMGTPGGFMGLSFADYNCDGELDIFASNFGDWANFTGVFQNVSDVGVETSEWYLGKADGSFSRPGVGDLIATPFGWGTVSIDYDNDADSDIIYHGGLFSMLIGLSNAGVILRNDNCSANFTYQRQALANSVDHVRRGVRGVSAGDLNNDGFLDLVTTSEFVVADEVPLLPFPVDHGSPFDQQARWLPLLIPTDVPGTLLPNLPDFDLGDLAVEINTGNTNGSINIKPMGSVNIVKGATVNRDGLGAVVSFKPKMADAKTSKQIILSGGSHLSQSPLNAHFGLANARVGTVDILWPGGVHNRLYRVKNGEQLVFPEIPCSYTDSSLNKRAYNRCVVKSLRDLRSAGTINRKMAWRLWFSARRAFIENRRSN